MILIAFLAILLGFLLFSIPASTPPVRALPQALSSIPPPDTTEPRIDPWASFPTEAEPNPLLEQKGILRNPGGYVEGECEKAAKDWQQEYGGELVFIAPYDKDTGAWVQGDYAGAWINKKGSVYYDYFYQMVYPTKEGVISFYAPRLSSKLGRDVGAKIYVLGTDTMPYPITYHY